MIEAAPKLLHACCASGRWVAAVAGAYPSLGALTEASDAALVELEWPDVLEALAAHPRIGDRPAGSGTEAAWSRDEQASVAGSDLTAELASGNVDYEQRFGYVYLVCATGRSPAELLGALQTRLAHDPVAEQAVVRDELAAIVRLRLAKAFGL